MSGTSRRQPGVLDRLGRWGCSRVLGVLAVGGLLGWGIAPAQAAPFAYIANGFDNTVLVIATATNTVVATVPVGRGPTDVAVHPVHLRRDGARGRL